MKPTEIIRWHNPNNKWIDIRWGANSSLVRNQYKDCVVAYYQVDKMSYLIIKCSKKMKVYRVGEFQWKFFGEELDFQEKIDGKNELRHISNLKWKILDKPSFDIFKREMLLEALK